MIKINKATKIKKTEPVFSISTQTYDKDNLSKCIKDALDAVLKDQKGTGVLEGSMKYNIDLEISKSYDVDSATLKNYFVQVRHSTFSSWRWELINELEVDSLKSYYPHLINVDSIQEATKNINPK